MTDFSFHAAAHGQPSTQVSEIDMLWITAGLGCDGDTIAMTAATQPSIEDLVLGGIPGVAKVCLHNPFPSYENGAEFMAPFHLAAEGKLAPFLLVVEGSIPDETKKVEGYWASFGTDQSTGSPILTCDWIEQLASFSFGTLVVYQMGFVGGLFRSVPKWVPG